MNKIKNILTNLNKKTEMANSTWHGCSNDQIDRLQNDLNIKLPEDYVDYLKIVGLGAGTFLQGTDAFYDDLFELKKFSIELLDENNIQNFLKTSDFVFSMHQGYEFIYLNTINGNSSPIVQFVEGENEPSLTWPSFADYLQEVVTQHVEN